MDAEIVPDSEDEEWRQPWSSPAQVAPTSHGLEDTPERAQPVRDKSLSPDELAVDFGVSPFISKLYSGTATKSRIHDSVAPNEYDQAFCLTNSQHIDSSTLLDELAQAATVPILRLDPTLDEWSQGTQEPLRQGILDTLGARLKANSLPPSALFGSSPTPVIVDHLQPSQSQIASPTIHAARAHSPIEIEAVKTIGRTLRPRTYQQLHTYEYEHAKYVLECRAAGIKPVKFDGTRYREMDPGDEDFVPPSTRIDTQRRVSVFSTDSTKLPEEILSVSEIAALPQSPSPGNKKRKRTKVYPKFKDPRLLVHDGLKTAQAQVPTPSRTSAPGVFDFPDEHWQTDCRLPTSSSPSVEDSSLLSVSMTEITRQTRPRAESIMIESASSDESLASQDSEAAAKARFARKLKGVLPPSYLSRKNDSENNRQFTEKRKGEELSKRLAIHHGKGVAKKKMSSILRPAFGMVTPSQSSDSVHPVRGPSDARLPESSTPARNIYEDDDIPEGEEEIDRMLPAASSTKKRLRRSRPRLSRVSQRLEAPEVYLQDLIQAQGRAAAPKEVRLACRTARRKNIGGTQLKRKAFHFHDRQGRLNDTAKGPSLVPGKSSSGSGLEVENSDDPEEMLIRWENNKLPGRTRPKEVRTARAPRMSHSKDVAHRRQERGQRTLPRDMNSKKRPVVSNIVSQSPADDRQPILLVSQGTGSGSDIEAPSATGGFFLDSDDDLPLPDPHVLKPPIPRQPASTNQQHGPATSPEAARTFAANLEHETGKYVSVHPSRQIRKKKSAYLQSFDQINNIFATEQDHYSKVSQWQTNQLSRASKQIEPTPKPGFTTRTRGCKWQARRAALKQNSILPFVVSSAAFNNDRGLSFDFPGPLGDVLLGAEPVISGTYFGSQTFLGSSGLDRVLSPDRDNRFTSCYIANRQLFTADFENGINYGFTAIGAVINALKNGQKVSEDSIIAVYDFFRYLTAIDPSAHRILEIAQARFRNLRNDLCQVSAYQNTEDTLSRLSIWCAYFNLVISLLSSHRSHDTLPTRSDDLEQSITLTLQTLLETGFNILANALRRFREPVTRVQGISTSYPESVLEAWVVVVHISQTTDLKFWDRINRLLELDRAPDRNVLERAWQSLLHLSSVTRFNVKGILRERNLSNWSTVENLLGFVLRDYDIQSELPSPHLDSYIRLLLRRVHVLIDLWEWPDCSQLLGHGRAGGTLHRFFLQDLGLCNLLTERRNHASFPMFLVHLDKSDCLRYKQTSMENTFEIFLKLVCLGIKQFIKTLNSTTMDLDRVKRRGIGVVDKFTTHGTLNYSATESIGLNTVIEVQNRFALEIAVYWSAGPWKDRGISSVIEASMAAMPGSHLALREINIKAIQIIAKIQLQKKEEDRLSETILWLTSVVQATVSDVLQFQHQVRLYRSDSNLQSQLNKDLRKCRQNLQMCYDAYFNILQHPAACATTRLVQILWCNDMLRAILQLHESFVETGHSLVLIEGVFQVVLALVESSAHLATEQDSQDYDDMMFSQDAQVETHELTIKGKLQDLAGLVFQYLTNVSAQEGVTTPNKVLAKMGLQAMARIVLALRSKEHLAWSELFSDRGTYSWTRLLDGPMKATMLPYYLAVLIEADPEFYNDMYPFILSSWFSCVTQMEIKDSLAALTTVLINKGSVHIKQHHLMTNTEQASISSDFIVKYRAEMLVQALQRLENPKASCDNEGTRDNLAIVATHALLSSVRSSYLAIPPSANSKRALYVTFIQEILAALHRFCSPILRLLTASDRQVLDWLSDPANVPQLRDGFAAETFRAYAHQDISRKGLEASLNFIARCDVQILDGGNDLPDILVVALGNNPLCSESKPHWDESIAKLRRLILGDLLCLFLDLRSDHESAALYLNILIKSANRVYEALLLQSWGGESNYILPLIKDCASLYTLLHGETLAAGITSICRQILSVISGYSCLDKATRGMVNKIVHQSEPDLAPLEIGRSAQLSPIRQAIVNHLSTTWKVTNAGLYHTKRKRIVTIPAEYSVPPLMKPPHQQMSNFTTSDSFGGDAIVSLLL